MKCLISAACFCLCGGALPAAAPKQEYRWTEIEKMARYQADDDFKTADKDGSGELNEKEKEEFLNIKLQKIEKAAVDFKVNVIAAAGRPVDYERAVYTQAHVKEATPPKPIGIEGPPLGIQVVRKFDDVDPWLPDLTDRTAEDYGKKAEAYAKRLKDKDAAIVSYYDLHNKGQGIQAQGVIARPWVFGDNLSVIPAIEFDRLSSDRYGVKETDSLRFRGSLAYRPDSQDSLYTFGWVYGTDFDLEKSSWMFDADATGNFWGQGRFHDLGLVDTRYRLYAHGELGEGLDNTKEDDFKRIGPRIKLDVIPSFESPALEFLNERLLLSTDYSYYWQLDSGYDYDLIKAALNWKLESWGHARLKLEYEYGFAPLNAERHDVLSFGIGIIY